MSDIACRVSADSWHSLFPEDWYYSNILEIYLGDEKMSDCFDLDLCEGWIERAKRDINGAYMMEGDSVVREKLYGEVTLKIRR